MRIIVIPDTQIKPGVSYKHLIALAHYIDDKRPSVVVHLGDHWDMPSLNTHTSRENIAYCAHSYAKDLASGTKALYEFTDNMGYKPRLVFCEGNHENRRDRLLEQDPRLIGALEDYPIESLGWERHKFLSPVKIGGVNFCHYAQGGLMGRPISRAHLIATKKHESWVVGHQQALDIYYSPFVKTDGSRVQCIIAGAFYTHKEDYKMAQGNQHWRGALMLNEVRKGSFDLCTLSVNYLLKEWI